MDVLMIQIMAPHVATPLWGKCEVAIHTPENVTWESWKIQNAIVGVKTPLIEVFFILLERFWSVDVRNGLAWTIWTFVAQVMAERRVGNRPDLGVWRWSATHRWIALKESYKFASDLVPIGGRSEKLWTPKASGVQTGIISGLYFGSPGTKSHLSVGAVE
jgi:hypothetical protein